MTEHLLDCDGQGWAPCWGCSGPGCQRCSGMGAYECVACVEENSLLPVLEHVRSKKTWGCSDQRCSLSTGIHEGLTFGRGWLDYNGFWSSPCAECARAWEAMHPEDGVCWPFPDQDSKFG